MNLYASIKSNFVIKHQLVGIQESTNHIFEDTDEQLWIQASLWVGIIIIHFAK